jgi:hypothetical protein
VLETVGGLYGAPSRRRPSGLVRAIWTRVLCVCFWHLADINADAQNVLYVQLKRTSDRATGREVHYLAHRTRPSRSTWTCFRRSRS